MASNDNQHSEYLQLLAANTKRLYAFIRILVLNDENEAEEIFQITCLTLWKKFDQYDPQGDFGAWACRMAHFETLRLRNSRKRIKFLSEEALTSLAEAAMPITEQINARRDVLAECVGKLVPEDVAMIRAKFFEAKSTKEMAKSANRSIFAIYRELTRIQAILKRCVERAMKQEGI